MPAQAGVPWLSIVPIAESRSSYNGLLVFLFITSSAWLAAYAIHRLASRAVRRAPAWGCGFPDPGLATQYSAGSFAQPIRRVFGAYAFRRQRTGGNAAPGISARRDRGDGCMISLGQHLHPHRESGFPHGRTARPAAIPEHPPVSPASSSWPWSFLLLVLALWP